MINTKIIDKRGIIANLPCSQPVVLELGCGSRKRNPLAIGIDALDDAEVDIVGDVYEVLAMFPSQSIDAVHSYHFVEHVHDVPLLIAELARVVKSNGYVEFVAPHFSNPYFYSDPTHRSYFGLYTFCYYADCSPFARQVPKYAYTALFDISKVELIFKSARPFFIRYSIKRLIGSIFNSCYYMRELYEEFFCYIFPCYEVRYILRKPLIKK